MINVISDMKKKIFIAVLALLFVLGLAWFFAIEDCVVNRRDFGIPTDWATIKDCSY